MTVGVPQHVNQLRKDLRELGFLVVAEPPADGAEFDMYTEWAVREFQIYASMTHVAKVSMEMAGGTETHNRLRAICALAGTPATATAPATTVNYPGEHPAAVAALGRVPAAVIGHPVSYYVASLDQVVNQGMYDGPISGVVNQRTRNAIAYWKLHRYRCPVVIEAWRVSNTGVRTDIANKQTTAGGGYAVNIWKYNEVNSAPRVYSIDLTQHYDYPEGRTRLAYNVLGEYLVYNTSWAGPTAADQNKMWREADMTPELLTGGVSTLNDLSQPANINGAVASTYRVIRAASEQECAGNFDSINCNDDALASMGHAHWTMGLRPNESPQGYKHGELSGFFAYFYDNYPSDYYTAFGRYGLFPRTRHASMVQSQGTYKGWWRVHDETLLNNVIAPPNLGVLPEMNNSINEGYYYRSWHWFFRYAMAGRCVAGYQQAMWRYIRIRLRNILNRSNPATITAGTVTFNANTVTLGEIFTSEKAIAILLRWHMNRPAHIYDAESTAAGFQHSGSSWKVIRATIANPSYSHINWTLPIASWNDDHERALARTLYDRARQVRPDAHMVDVWEWPTDNKGFIVHNQLGSLRDTRNSFVFDTTGI